MALEDISSKNLLRIRHFSRSESTEDTFDDWQHYAEHECNVGFDRYTQFPFFLTVWANEKASRARLMLFSDHYMSDGRSGMAVLNCVLEQVSLLSGQDNQVEDLPVHVHEFPLHPSFYEMWLSKNLLLNGLLKGVMHGFGEAIYRSEMKKFKPVLPARDDQHDFVAPPVKNSTSASFMEGDPVCMRKALEKCREEGVTFGGALVAAITLVFYHTAMAQQVFQPGPFKVAADVDYNMRQRMPCQAEEDQVGAYIAFTGLEWLANEGIDIKTTRFWDLAHRAKSRIDGNLHNSVTMAAMTNVIDQNLNSQIKPSLAKSVNIRHSQTSDANISNVGRFPYAKEHPLTSKSEEKYSLVVKNLHVYNPVPHLGPSAVFFVSAVESFCYSMGHKCEDDAGKALFTAWVAICEHIGNIGADDTLVDVLEHRNIVL